MSSMMDIIVNLMLSGTMSKAGRQIYFLLFVGGSADRCMKNGNNTQHKFPVLLYIKRIFFDEQDFSFYEGWG